MVGDPNISLDVRRAKQLFKEIEDKCGVRTAHDDLEVSDMSHEELGSEREDKESEDHGDEEFEKDQNKHKDRGKGLGVDKTDEWLEGVDVGSMTDVEVETAALCDSGVSVSSGQRKGKCKRVAEGKYFSLNTLHY